MSHSERIKHLLAAVAVSGIAVAGSAAPAQPADTAEPEQSEKAEAKDRTGTVDEKSQKVLDAYIKAIGGREKIESIKSLRQTGSFSMPQQGMQATMTVLSHTEHGVKATIALEGLGEFYQGVHKKQGWSVDPMSGPQLSPPEMSEQLARSSDPQSVLKYNKYYETVTYAGETEFEGKAVDQLSLVDWNGNESTQYFDKESGMLIGEQSVQASPYGNMTINSVYSDFKEFEGVTYPTTTTIKSTGQEQIIKVETVKLNDVKADEIAPPEAIKNLIAEDSDL